MRRFVLTCVIPFVLATPSWAQQTAKVPAVDVLLTHAAVTDQVFDRLHLGLRDFGYEDGKNIRVEILTAEGQMDRLQGLADELVRRRVDVIVCPNEPSTRTAMKATSTISEGRFLE